MSLELCPDCQHIIHENSVSCPHCGLRFQETVLQRCFRIAVRLALIVAMLGGIWYGILLLQGESPLLPD